MAIELNLARKQEKKKKQNLDKKKRPNLALVILSTAFFSFSRRMYGRCK